MKRLALIIGASGYIGSEVQKSLRELGFETIGSYHQNKIQDDGEHCDLTDPKSIAALCEKITRPVDAIVFAAGIDRELNVDEDRSKLNYQIFTKSNLVQSVGPYDLIGILNSKKLLKRPSNIIFVGSLVGTKSIDVAPEYALSKGTLKGLVQSLSKQLGRDGVLINCVDPGLLEDGAGKIIDQKSKKSYLKHCSLKRFGTNKDMAKTISWIVSENTYITGQNFVLDGGL
ncbi:MAG: SDR family oxidoreductase [Bacteriovoracaceae bacterium]|jgi:3-oxoacyl-[acyl-carrier protein] reductase|nr:SDR family oxidoreductase [Bacteriovoracaceae bacterium]